MRDFTQDECEMKIDEMRECQRKLHSIAQILDKIVKDTSQESKAKRISDILTQELDIDSIISTFEQELTIDIDISTFEQDS